MPSRLSLAFCLAFALAPQVSAQSIFGEIRGLITDRSGAVIAGVSVTVTNTGTTESRKVQSDEAGQYSAVNLPAGNYVVKAEQPGFKPAETKDVTLRARQVARIDIAMEVGEVSSEVTVTAARQVINTEVATVSDSKTGKDINNLPVLFRGGNTNSILSTLSLNAQVQTDLGGGSVSVGGNMPFQSTASVDGVSAINVRSNGILGEMLPSGDTVAEVKINSISNNAEFAQVGDVTVTSRTGSNNFNGSVFWYHQNGAFDARNFFAAQRPFKVSNDLGVSAGGPIIKNKTFFFAVYEGLRFRAQRPINIIVPPDSFRRGDFSSVSTMIRDPLNNNQPFANNQIPAARISSVSTALLNGLYPRQNVVGDQIANPNYRLLQGQTFDNNSVDVRIDHALTSKQNLFGRFGWKDRKTSSPDNLFATIGDQRNSIKPVNLLVAHNWILKTNLINEFRFGYAYQESFSDFGPGGKPFEGAALIKPLNIVGLNSSLIAGANAPDVGIVGFEGTAKGRAAVVRSGTFQGINNLTWIKGKHTYKFGFDIRRLRTTDITSFNSGGDLGEYRFDRTYTGFAFSDFLLGIPTNSRIANPGPDVDGVTYHTGLYAQDDWKVTRRLTLSFGVRWEVHPMFFDRALTTSNFDRAFPGPGGRVIIANEEARALTAPAFIASIGNTPIVTAKEAGLPETLRFTDWNNFAPRFGFAWRPFGERTVLRGGYGIFTATILGSVFYTITGIHVSDVRTFVNATGANGRPNLIFPAPFGAAGGTAAVGSADFRRGTQFDGPDPYSQQWHLTFERDLGLKTSLRTTYTGSRTIKMFSSVDLNQVQPNTTGFANAFRARPYQNWNIIYARDPNSQAWYNALTTEVLHRSSSFVFQSSWTWAKHLSNAIGSDGSGFASENGTVPTTRFDLMLDYGNVGPTRRHRWLTTAYYDLPFGKWISGDSGAARFGRAAAGGWNLGGILLLQTGPFLTPTFGTAADPSGTNIAGRGGNNRADIATGKTLNDAVVSSDIRGPLNWFDRSAFSIPASNIGRYGNVALGSLVGPATSTLSLRLAKQIAFTERFRLQLEGAASNLFNTANFAAPAMNVAAGNFGRITATQPAEQGGPRNLQVSLRLLF